jgi:hypothetical protein
VSQQSSNDIEFPQSFQGRRGTQRVEEKSAGYLLLGVWGYPPVSTSPKIGGYRGLKVVAKRYQLRD